MTNQVAINFLTDEIQRLTEELKTHPIGSLPRFRKQLNISALNELYVIRTAHLRTETAHKDHITDTGHCTPGCPACIQLGWQK